MEWTPEAEAAFKELLERESGQTGEPMDIPNRDWPMVEGKRRFPKQQKLSDLDIHETQKNLLAAAGARFTQTQDQFTSREAELKDRKVPASTDKVVTTDWRTVPGYPALPTDPATGDVIASSYVAPSLGSSLSSGIGPIVKQVLKKAAIPARAMRQALSLGNAAISLLPYPMQVAVKAGVITLTVAVLWYYFPSIVKEALARVYAYIAPWQNLTRAFAGKTTEETAAQIITESGLGSMDAYTVASSQATGADAVVQAFQALTTRSPEAAQVLARELEQQAAEATTNTVTEAARATYVPGQGFKNALGYTKQFWGLAFTAAQAVTENVADTLGAPKNVPDLIRWGNSGLY
jgi:hypothetical protein